VRPRFAAALTSVLAPILVAFSLLAPVALGDGDPASDVLLGQNVFYSYSPTAKALQTSLNTATAAASRARFPIKVALIESGIDLGVIPELFGKPQQYAHFLDQEISFQGKQLLLVVMKTGYGVEGLSAPATAAAAKLPLPTGGTSDDLAKAALTAVVKLAAAAGHPLSGVRGSPTSTGGGGGSTKTLIVIVLVLAAVATAGALLVVRRRETT
jgi:hypothetical protein